MLQLEARRQTLRMSPEALARRSKLSREVVRAVLSGADGADATAVEKVRRSLGVGPDGERLVPARTFRKHCARKKATFIVSMVQGTMGLEAQGLKPGDKQHLYQQTYRRLKANPTSIW